MVMFLQGMAHWKFFFFLDSACEKSHVVVFFHTCNFASALDEHESGQRHSGKTYSSHFP